MAYTLKQIGEAVRYVLLHATFRDENSKANYEKELYGYLSPAIMRNCSKIHISQQEPAHLQNSPGVSFLEPFSMTLFSTGTIAVLKNDCLSKLNLSDESSEESDSSDDSALDYARNSNCADGDEELDVSDHDSDGDDLANRCFSEANPFTPLREAKAEKGERITKLLSYFQEKIEEATPMERMRKRK